MRVPILNPKNPNQAFPSLEQALQEPDGLLAIGGCLSQQRLINAYRHGIFPWYDPHEPILWWSPDPRTVIFPQRLHISQSLRKTLRKNGYTVTIDQAFSRVIDACSKPRAKAAGTWISNDIKRAYNYMHKNGIAHSAEAWQDGELVGGLYGVAIGRVFFGESMFHTRTDASKVAFAKLVEQLLDWNYELIDCQVYNPHLASLGAEEISRTDFKALLDHLVPLPADPLAWQIP
ncbi:leucyl/phenylalanyl-tRNA--protein transferase [Methylosoma difficile]